MHLEVFCTSTRSVASGSQGNTAVLPLLPPIYFTKYIKWTSASIVFAMKAENHSPPTNLLLWNCHLWAYFNNAIFLLPYEVQGKYHGSPSYWMIPQERWYILKLGSSNPICSSYKTIWLICGHAGLIYSVQLLLLIWLPHPKLFPCHWVAQNT